MKCPKCGRIYKQNEKFCMNCGCGLINEIAIVPSLDPELGSLDTQLVNKKATQYSHEAQLADKVYKSYVTNGVSRLDKVNGRFLASQTIKLDIIIEQNSELIKQNNKIIELLDKISFNMQNDSE